MPHSRVRKSIVWLASAGVVGFSVPAIFSLRLRLERAVFLLPYVGIVGVFLVAYFRARPLPKQRIVASWRVGLLLAVAASLFLVRNVISQPATEAPEGAALVGALLWMGLAYGAVDGLFLNVMPVLAVYDAWSVGADTARSARILRGVAALCASLLVTAAYHLGYAEFQGSSVLPVLLGNAIITATYVLSGSPLAPIVTHVVMHIAAVLHGMETTLQLPPHY